MISGDTEVKVGEKTYQLALTLAAMERINAQFSSLLDARQRVGMYDFDGICGIIAAGAGLSAAQAKALRAEVFSAGVVNVSKQVHTYIIRMFDPEDRGSTEDKGSGEA